jgi:4-hydroxybenzoyl-CoA thioesterase
MQSTQQTRPRSRPVTDADDLIWHRDHTTVHHHRVTPADLGGAGVVDGGTLLEWIHDAAFATATQWSGRPCVTASVGHFHLDRPIRSGELVELHADLAYTGRSSMHILVTICTSDPSGRNALQTAQCPIIFVATDARHAPVEVPRWNPVTMLELQRQRQARVRVSMRKRIERAVAAASHLDAGTARHATVRRVVTIDDVGACGSVPGSRVMRWMDDAARACGDEWTGSHVITSYLAGIRFCRPVFAGDVIEVSARMIHTGMRSVHIAIQITTTDIFGLRSHVVAQAVAVVVALDDHGAARGVGAWQPDSDEERQLDLCARQLIELRGFVEPFSTAVVGFSDGKEVGS